MTPPTGATPRIPARRLADRVADLKNRLPLFALMLLLPQLDQTQERHEAAVGHHLERTLNAAAEGYDEVLRRDPPRELTAAESRLVERFAPRLFVTRSEPFQLKDAAAIMHPDGRTIAYHLFWDDDIDFPDDNEPSDHEVVWCVIEPDGTALAAFYTLFHNRVFAAPPEALRDAGAHRGRPAALVQWGKHGAMPVGWQRLPIVADDADTEAGYYEIDKPITLEDYNRGTWRKLNTVGRRLPENPLAMRAGWPTRFEGDWAAFATFPRLIDPLPQIRSRRSAVMSRWNAAVLSRWLIRYNFRPKQEWPTEADAAPPR